MLLPVGPFLHPPGQGRDFLFRQLALGIGGWHPLLPFASNPLKQMALGRIARLDDAITTAIRQQFRLHVQTKVRLSRILVGSMTTETGICQDGANFKVEIHRLLRIQSDSTCHQAKQNAAHGYPLRHTAPCPR